MQTQEIFEKLEVYIAGNGPAPEQYEELNTTIQALGELVKLQVLDPEAVESIRKSCPFLADSRSIMGHILTKPFGYPGDYHIIDRIYTRNLSALYPKWDHYSLENAAAQAVRNRKDYFKKAVRKVLPAGGMLLNVASGPSRDLFELYSEQDVADIRTTCVEMDSRAIEYAKALNGPYLDRVDFINETIFKFQTDEKFDLIWSAGLFDYFDDEAFVQLLVRFREWLQQEGEIIIGNFNQQHNPSRLYMELFGDWYLNHRSEDQLRHLAQEAGFKKDKVRVGREPENVNLFLHLNN